MVIPLSLCSFSQTASGSDDLLSLKNGKQESRGTRPSIIPALSFLFATLILSSHWRNVILLGCWTLLAATSCPAVLQSDVVVGNVKFILILLVLKTMQYSGQLERMMENKISKRCGFACTWRAYCTSGMVRQRLCLPRQDIRDACIGRKSWGW